MTLRFCIIACVVVYYIGSRWTIRVLAAVLAGERIPKDITDILWIPFLGEILVFLGIGMGLYEYLDRRNLNLLDRLETWAEKKHEQWFTTKDQHDTTTT